MIEKTAIPTSHANDGRKPRSDGEQSRERLLHSAIRLFAEQGYAKTSTRELAQAAGTNAAAIGYYFGDKAGLYRAAFAQ
jgi:AcrR family transcriptional regulator